MPDATRRDSAIRFVLLRTRPTFNNFSVGLAFPGGIITVTDEEQDLTWGQAAQERKRWEAAWSQLDFFGVLNPLVAEMRRKVHA